MTTKPFTPKLMPARQKLTQALNAPALNQFTPRMLAAIQGAAAKQVAQKNGKKNKTSAILKALTGQF